MESESAVPRPASAPEAFPALLAWTLLPLALGARLLAPASTDAPLALLGRHGATPDAIATACWEAWTRLWASLGATAAARRAAAAGWTAMLLPARDEILELARWVADQPPPSEAALAAALKSALAAEPADDRLVASEADLALAAWMRVAISNDQALDALANGRLRALFELAWRHEVACRPAQLAPVLLAERLSPSERRELFTAAGLDELGTEVLEVRAQTVTRRVSDRAQARRDHEDLTPPKATQRWGDRPLYQQAVALSQAAAQATAQGDFADAAAQLERALELDERRPNDWLTLARVRFELGRWDDGMTAYRSAIDLDPQLRLTPHGVELLRVLDRGPLSVRFLARSGDGDFVVEPIPPRLHAPARMIAVETRCLRLSGVDHADLVRSQVLHHGHHALLVTPRVRGRSFGEIWAETDCDTERLFHVVDRVCDQLEALHAAGLVHGRLGMDVVVVEWPRVRVGGIALEPLLATDPTVHPKPDEDVRAVGQLLASGLERGSPRATTVGIVYRPLVELMAMSIGQPESRATLGRFRTALDLIRFDPGALQLLEPG